MSDKKYTIRLLYDCPGWAYYWRCIALQKYAPPDFDVSIGSNYGEALRQKKHDLILQLAFSYAKDVKKHLTISKHNALLVSSYNVGWGYANKWLDMAINDSDHVIVNSLEMWEKYGKHPKTYHISNGVDLDTFNVKIPIESRKPKVLWVGSIGHRKTKNYDSILVPLAKQCKAEKIHIDFRLVDSVGKNRMNQEQMRDWYNSGTIYVVASSSEGTPNPGIESAACGCTVVSTRVGNMPELIDHGKNGYLCDTNVNSLMQGIRMAIEKNKELSFNMQETIKSWGWKERSQKYYEYFRKILNS